MTAPGGVGQIVAHGIGVEKAEIEGDETSTKADDGPKNVPHESMLLADLAGFESPAVAEEIMKHTQVKEKNAAVKIQPQQIEGGALTVNINIQIQLPTTDDATI